jgi:glycosyltransferase involved in cell wall biosynthesis
LGLPGKGILIIVENLPVPFDRRVWNEATALKRAGYRVCVICPTGKGFERREEVVDGVTVYRHPLPTEGSGAFGYALEYSMALFWETVLAWKALFRHGFDAIQACNPPDTIFIVGLMFKLLGKRFVFDHHDINPELYLAKFGRKDFLYYLVVFLERMTFLTADISIATNQSYREIALRRGKMRPDRVFVVRSGPDLSKLRETAPREVLRKGRRYLVGYVGVMGRQEGLSYLLEAASYIVHTKKRTDVQFAIVGHGTEFESLREYSRELGLEHYVDFTGRISDGELATYLSTADVCVNPDVANEMNDKSTMNKIMEYMAFRRPIVQFDLVEGRFSAGDASLYALRNDPVDLAEKVLSLLEDPERRKAMGDFGRSRVETELAWEYSEKELLCAYIALFHGNQRSYHRVSEVQDS